MKTFVALSASLLLGFAGVMATPSDAVPSVAPLILRKGLPEALWTGKTMHVANTTKSERGSLGGRVGEVPERGIEGEMECGQAGNSLAGVWGGNPKKCRLESKPKVLPLNDQHIFPES